MTKGIELRKIIKKMNLLLLEKILKVTKIRVLIILFLLEKLALIMLYNRLLYYKLIHLHSSICRVTRNNSRINRKNINSKS
jgi:hypothetical protein